MKYGMVSQIRINPRDCQSVLDMMGVLGIDPYDGRSFAQCVSLALSSMLGAYRQGGLIPEPDDFQYLNRLGPFLHSGNNKKKKASSDQLYRMGGGAMPAPVMPGAVEVKHPSQFVPGTMQQMGWTESGPVATAAIPPKLDDDEREVLIERFQALNETWANHTKEEREEYEYLDKLLCR